MIFAYANTPNERRTTLRLLSYWEKLRRGRSMPHEKDISEHDIGDLWDHCFLVHTENLVNVDYCFSYLGEAIRGAYHPEAEEIKPHAHPLAKHFTHIAQTGKPVVDEGEFVNVNNQVVKYRQCLVPLGKDGKVEAIFGAMRYKIF